MATYKVIQDVEAEDKLLGPLTLRQFSYAGITVGFLWLCYFSLAHHAAFLIAVFLPFAVLSGFFAFPWSREQPTELWALARIRFLFKPRKRIWDQSGIKELVTITVPKRIEHMYSDGLSQTEVRSRLHALAETIDSRGWAIKNTTMNPYISPAMATVTGADDRLIDPGSVPQEVSTLGNENTFEDVFDASSNPKIHQFDSMLTASAEAHKAQLIASMQQPSPPQAQPASSQPTDYWFLNQPSLQNIPQGSSVFGTSTVTPGSDDAVNATVPTSTTDENAIIEELRQVAKDSQAESAHMATVLPLEEQEKRQAAAQKAEVEAANASQTPVTAPPDTAILGLAHNDDLNIETIARQAKREQAKDDGEVVISLH